jgi:tetratricopeptide (TPR) repeat protein
MRRISKKKSSAVGQGARTMPSESELLRKLRNIEEVNQRIAASTRLQEVMREMLGQPAETPRPSMEQTRENLRRGGLSYLASPPADLPQVAPEAHKLWLGDAVIGSLRGDDALCLAKYRKALEIVRKKGHRTAEARLLYNIGLAHYKLGEYDSAIHVLLEGKTLTKGADRALRREARRVQRFEEEAKTDDPRRDVLGVPDTEPWLLVKYLEALAIVYEADSQAAEAASCRAEIKRLNLQST